MDPVFITSNNIKCVHDTVLQVSPILLSVNTHALAQRHLLSFRRSKDHIILAGLWCSTCKPAAFSFLEPIFKRLKSLEDEGILS